MSFFRIEEYHSWGFEGNLQRWWFFIELFGRQANQTRDPRALQFPRSLCGIIHLKSYPSVIMSISVPKDWQVRIYHPDDIKWWVWISKYIRSYRLFWCFMLCRFVVQLIVCVIYLSQFTIFHLRYHKMYIFHILSNKYIFNNGIGRLIINELLIWVYDMCQWIPRWHMCCHLQTCRLHNIINFMQYTVELH